MIIQNILNPSWKVNECLWCTERPDDLAHWENKEDGINSVYESWKCLCFCRAKTRDTEG